MCMRVFFTIGPSIIRENNLNKIKLLNPTVYMRDAYDYSVHLPHSSLYIEQK